MKRLLMILFLGVIGAGQGLAYTVTLAWDRSSDNGSIIIAGYNVYRSSTSGGPYTKLNVMIIPQVPGTEVPMYVDPTPTGTITYYYTVTAVSTGGVESAKSNEVAANPPPAPPTNLRIVSFSAANLNIDGQKVAGGPPFPVVYILPRQTPPRTVPITVTVE
jgi:fibronectin type 3 domain-containing protein